MAMSVKSSVLSVSVAIATVMLSAHGVTASATAQELAESVTHPGSTSDPEIWRLVRDAQNELKHISDGLLYLSSRLDALNGAAGHDDALKALGRLAGRNNAVVKRLNDIVATTRDIHTPLAQYGESLRGLPQVTQELKKELAGLQTVVRQMESGSTTEHEPKSKSEAIASKNSSLGTATGKADTLLTDEQKNAVEAAAAQAIATARPDIPPGTAIGSQDGAPDPVDNFTLQVSPDNANQKLVPGVFENHLLISQGASLAQMKIAVIDASNGSKEWLRHHRAYLEQESIPVMVIEADEAAFNALHQEFLQGAQASPSNPATSESHPVGVEVKAIPKGQLILGREPEAGRGLIQNVLWQMGVRHFPVVIEDGVAWQESPEVR